VNVLLTGAGMQGKAALHDLAGNPRISRIVVADRDLAALQAHLARREYGPRVRAVSFQADEPGALDRLLAEPADLVVDLLPPDFTARVAASAVAHGRHLVNTCYVKPEMKELADDARMRGISVLPEFGMDPGIDLVLLGEAVRRFDSVEGIACYGTGLPAPGAADNPIKYKVTWSFAGVLRAYRRGARLVRDGRVLDLAPSATFAAGNVHPVDLPGLGELEAYANGDALPYAAALGLDLAGLKQLGRYTLRWPGHCAFWKKLIDLHLLDEEPLLVDGMSIDRLHYLAAAIEPHIRLGPAERDVALIRVEVYGIRSGKRQRLRFELVDWRDLKTGFTAMNRLVGFTASIGAQMILDGRITRRGLLSPLCDVPFAEFCSELQKRGISVRQEIADTPADPAPS
jgi:lysine 6-dehydrogenase